MAKYYAEFEWKDPTIIRSLPNDGHRVKDFIDDWEAFCYFVQSEYKDFPREKVYLMIVYAENEDGSYRTVYEHKK